MMTETLRRSLRLAAAVAAFAILVPPAGRAQSGDIAEIVAGASAYDLSGTGTSAFYAARVLVSLHDYVAVEPALEYFGYEAQSGDRVHYLLPELQLQARVPLARGAVIPYVGVGPGFAVPLTSGSGETESTLSAALGARIRLSPTVGILGEARLRSVRPWTGSVGDFGLGVWWVFF